jgi:hypothetical protein
MGFRPPHNDNIITIEDLVELSRKIYAQRNEQTPPLVKQWRREGILSLSIEVNGRDERRVISFETMEQLIKTGNYIIDNDDGNFLGIYDIDAFEAFLNSDSVPQPQPQPQSQPQQTAPKQKRQIGFRMSRDDLIDTILDNVYSVGDKIPSKRTLVNTNNRNETKVYESTMKDLKQMGVVEFQRGKGYFLAVDYNTALSILES